MEPIHILGISGSLRTGSYNTMLLRAAAGMMPQGSSLGIFDLAPIPLYNEDIRTAGYPEAIAEFRRRVAEADAVLIATPEYNHSIPGVLKNAIDWASRPPEQPFGGKIVAMMGAGNGFHSTVRAQLHLKTVCNCLNARLMNYPEVYVTRAQEKFTADGVLTDGMTEKFLGQLLASLVDAVKASRSV